MHMFDDSSSAVKMNRYTVSPLKIGLRVDYKGASYKITDHFMEQNAVRQYIIQSMADGGTKRVFRHEICDARVSSVFSNLTEDTIFNFENNEQSQSDEELSQIDEDLTANCINQEPPAKKPRFKELPSKEEIEKLALARTEPRTNQQTLWGVKLLRGWLTENKYSSSFEELDETTLNDRLCYFMQSLQTKQGNDYSKSALVGIRSAISRHITGPPYNRDINIITDKSFMPSNHVITGMMKKLKREGKDITVHKKAVAEGDIQKLYSSGIFSTDHPVTLQNKVFWDIMLNFGRRGQEGLAELKKTSYAKSKDDKGQEYYKMTYNECDKTHHGVDSKENSRDVRMYAKPGDIHCPVFSLDFYLGKLSPRCTAFFQQALQYPKPTVWYAAQPIGKNKLASMMSRISDEAGLSIRYTNHCLRATVATGLKRAGVDDRAIMSVTGHRNVKSLDSYIEGPTDKQRRELSNTLQGVATANSDLALIENKTESNALATSAQNNSCQLAAVYGRMAAMGSYNRRNRFKNLREGGSDNYETRIEYNSNEQATQFGRSLQGTNLSTLMTNKHYSIVVSIEITNLTKNHLTKPKWKTYSGYISSPAVSVGPAHKEAMAGHDTHKDEWFSSIRNKRHSTDLKYRFSAFGEKSDEIMIEDEGFQIYGSMGSSSKPEVKITLRSTITGETSFTRTE
ncbi:unnamed protein product [Mytilus edulis]|uniref:Tyr recombinase domain-containing protein n=1 Tax=Mytilus edulis TaxID=6550 RepID=A0A8S3S3Y2_MYTED|nr:unnamed protein product [Mytilus edulis]